MAGVLALAKANLRQAVHDAFCVDATYKDSSLTEAVAITVRWHNQIANLGQMDADGYAELIQGIERIIFNTTNLTDAGVTLKSKGVVTITLTGWGSPKFSLTTKEPMVGPLEEIWQVTRL